MNLLNTTLEKATVKILSPVMYLLLRHRVLQEEFDELAKWTYVDMAYKHLSILKDESGYKAVAEMTGLTIDDVSRLTAIDQKNAPALLMRSSNQKRHPGKPDICGVNRLVH